VQANKYLLYQIVSLMRSKPGANETRRKRPAQRSRKLLEHAFIGDDFATPFGAHGVPPTLFAFFDHLFGSRCDTNTGSINIISPQKFRSQLCEPVAKTAFGPKDALERIAQHLSRRPPLANLSFFQLDRRLWRPAFQNGSPLNALTWTQHAKCGLAMTRVIQFCQSSS
jgi:hypothetical protein